MPNDFIAVDGVVLCPSCGARNRIGTYSTSLRPVCAKCKTPLNNVVDAYTPKQPSAYIPHPDSTGPKKKRKWEAYLSFALVAGAVVTFCVIALRSAARSKTAPVRPSYNYQQPSSVAPRTWEQPATSLRNRRLLNGTIIRNTPLTGNGSLTVINGLDSDAVAKLVNRLNNGCQAFFYVEANSAFTLSRVPDGDYRLLFGTGSDWDDTTGFFTRNRDCSEFNKPMDFETTTKTERRGLDDYLVTYYSENSITLHPVPDGNARTHDVSESEFQKY